MPGYKPSSETGEPIPATVFEAVAQVVQRKGKKEIIPLHLGDSHAWPPDPARPTALDLDRWKGFSQYCDTRGIAPLKDLLLDKLKTRNGMDWITGDRIQITCGAIHALYSTFATLLDPGDEVMSLSPHWHLTNPVIGQAGGVPVDTDFYIPLAEDPDADVDALLKAGLTDRTAAIYMNTPCNPTGMLLNRTVLEKIAQFAKKHCLWVVSDEAYEDFIYTDKKHISIATLPGMHDRTVSIFTFSKCLAAAGYRVGYAMANAPLIARMHHASTQTIYNAPTNNQYMVAQALTCWNDWFPELFQGYKKKRDLVCSNFKGRFFHPEGSFYVFFDASDCLKGRTPEELLEAMVDEGVTAVPGHAFGRGLESWFRFCFVAVTDDRLEEGIARLNRVVAG